MKCAVFTARIGERCDALRDPAFVAPETRYYCGSDRPVESSVWRRIELPAAKDPALSARIFKALLHAHAGHADYYLWIDARYRLEVDPDLFAPMLLKADVLVLRHPFCSSLQDEAAEIKRRSLVPVEVLNRQLAEYKAARFPSSLPHASTGFVVRRNDRRTRRFNEAWASQIQKHGHSRDQMSFDFAAWKAGLSVAFLEGHYRDNPYATWGETA